MDQQSRVRAASGTSRPPAVLMLLTNAYDPDPRVRQEALALIRTGVEVRILAWDRDLKSPRHECMEGVDVERVFLRSLHGRGNVQVFFYAWLYLQMFWRAWRTRFDVIHCHDLDTLPLGWILGKLKGKPIVYDAHESFPDMLEGSVHAAIRRGLVRIENFLIRRIDLLITVGEKLRRHFADRGARRSAVVGNWKRLEEFSCSEQDVAALRSRLGIPASAVAVVCICQLFKDRKIAELLEAVRDCSDVYVIIGGKGALEPTVQSAAAANPRIRYVGFVPATEIPAYTCAADIVYYGFDSENPNARFSAPNKLFEALAAVKPIITGDFGEIGDIVRKEGCGIILPDYSPASIRGSLTTLQDAAVRRKLAENARRCGAVLNWAKGEETLRREYAALLPERLRTSVAAAMARSAATAAGASTTDTV